MDLNENGKNKSITVINERQYSMQICFTWFSALIFITELIVDFCVASYHFNENQVPWGLYTIIIIIVPLILCQIYSMWLLKNENNQIKASGICFHLILCGILYRHHNILRRIDKDKSSNQEANAIRTAINNINSVQTLNAVFQYCPQFLLQSYLIIYRENKSVLTGKETVTLSPQHLLSCVRRQQGCKGGHLDWAWNYFRKIGIVDDDCFPYIAASNKCKIRRTDSLASAGCKLPTKVPRNHLYRVGPAYSLNNETDIMIEIMESGPVQATMYVYRDFFAYQGGIYKHSAASRSEQSGFHSVRLVGWGVERNGFETTKYWIAANSWGTWWGENGFFRILRGSNECEIENYVLATWPHIHLKIKSEKVA